MKTHRNKKIAGRLLMASGLTFLVTAAIMPQPAFYGVGAALLAIGIALFSKGSKANSAD
ncbi:MAG TPA: hypothetical protein VF861_04455 [Telluria sp.]